MVKTFTVTKNGKKVKLHVGQRGGIYILKGGSKQYIKKTELKGGGWASGLMKSVGKQALAGVKDIGKQALTNAATTATTQGKAIATAKLNQLVATNIPQAMNTLTGAQTTLAQTLPAMTPQQIAAFQAGQLAAAQAGQLAAAQAAQPAQAGQLPPIVARGGNKIQKNLQQAQKSLQQAQNKVKQVQQVQQNKQQIILQKAGTVLKNAQNKLQQAHRKNPGQVKVGWLESKIRQNRANYQI